MNCALENGENIRERAEQRPALHGKLYSICARRQRKGRMPSLSGDTLDGRRVHLNDLCIEKVKTTQSVILHRNRGSKVLLAKLGAIQSSVQAIPRQQFGMRAALDNLSGIYDEDHVRR